VVEVSVSEDTTERVGLFGHLDLGEVWYKVKLIPSDNQLHNHDHQESLCVE
jgi:hypothetical protein